MKKNEEEKDKKIQELEKKIEELTNNWKRALADYQNLQKRVALEKESWLKTVSQALIKNLLPVLDTLEQVNSHLKDQGLALALKQFNEVLAKEGLQEIKALGCVFNPAIHECLEVVEGEEDNKIDHVFTKGYQLNGFLLRPAKVRVVKRKTKAEKSVSRENQKN